MPKIHSDKAKRERAELKARGMVYKDTYELVTGWKFSTPFQPRYKLRPRNNDAKMNGVTMTRDF